MDRGETQGLERGLQVLACVIRLGTATAREVAEKTGLSETTVRRLLNTLDAAGYVIQGRSRQPYRATFKLAELAAALPPEIKVREAARLAIAESARSYDWPMAFIQWTGKDLEVTETTPRFATLEPTRYLQGWRLRPPFGASAYAMAVFGTGDVRVHLTALSASTGDPFCLEVKAVERSILTQGYAIARRRTRQEQSLAVPWMIGRYCAGVFETRLVAPAAGKDRIKRMRLAELNTCVRNASGILAERDRHFSSKQV